MATEFRIYRKIPYYFWKSQDISISSFKTNYKALQRFKSCDKNLILTEGENSLAPAVLIANDGKTNNNCLCFGSQI